jgi:hypothetical protein
MTHDDSSGGSDYTSHAITRLLTSFPASTHTPSERYLDGPSALRIRNTRRDRLPWVGLLASAVVVAGAWWIGRHKSRWLS